MGRDALGVTIDEVQDDDLSAISEIDFQVTGIRKDALWEGLLVASRSKGGSYFLVARADNAVIGYVVGEIRAWEFGSPPCGWLFAIGVDPAFRLHQVGTTLFHELMTRFRKKGLQTCRTMLHIDDHLLMSFFRSQGLTAGPFIELEMRLEANSV